MKEGGCPEHDIGGGEPPAMTVDLRVEDDITVCIHGSFWRARGSRGISKIGHIFSRKLDLGGMFPLIYLDELHEAGTEGLEYAAKKGLGIIIMEPLRGGTLTYKIPKEIEEIWNESEIKRTPAEWALRWLWNKPEITTVLSGMNVDELKLSVRAQNCLRSANIKTLADLVKHQESEMLQFRNFGRKSLAELGEILQQNGLSFGMDVEKYLSEV